MIHIRDNFMKIYDNSQFGIRVRMKQFSMLLNKIARDIYELFEQQKLKPEFYAFRWLTLLLSQEFYLPDVLRIWDSLFANQEKDFEFLLYTCCAMVMYAWIFFKKEKTKNIVLFFSLQRNQLLIGSEAQNIKLLQVCNSKKITKKFSKCVL